MIYEIYKEKEKISTREDKDLIPELLKNSMPDTEVYNNNDDTFLVKSKPNKSIDYDNIKDCMSNWIGNKDINSVFLYNVLPIANNICLVRI